MPVSYSKLCKICQSAPSIRAVIETGIVKGKKYDDIIADAKALGFSINGVNIHNHKKNHYNFEGQSLKKLAQKELSQKAGMEVSKKLFASGKKSYTDDMTVLREIIEKAYENLDGDPTVNAVTAIRAIEELRKRLDEQKLTIILEDPQVKQKLMNLFDTLLQVVKKYVTPEIEAKIKAELFEAMIKFEKEAKEAKIEVTRKVEVEQIIEAEVIQDPIQNTNIVIDSVPKEISNGTLPENN